jgi:hypothetical protein
LHETRSGLPEQGYNSTAAVEGLIAQLHSQGKLTMPSRENLKIRHK